MKKVTFYLLWAFKIMLALPKLPSIIRKVNRQLRQEKAMRELACAINRSGAIKVNGKPWYGDCK